MKPVSQRMFCLGTAAERGDVGSQFVELLRHGPQVFTLELKQSGIDRVGHVGSVNRSSERRAAATNEGAVLQ